MKNLITLIINIILVLSIGIFFNLPWWVFTIPVILLGCILSLKDWKVSYFLIGFIAGFLIWTGMNAYFDYSFAGVVLERLAATLSLNKLILLLAAGIIGGLLNGLALYTGSIILIKKENAKLDKIEVML